MKLITNLLQYDIILLSDAKNLNAVIPKFDLNLKASIDSIFNTIKTFPLKRGGYTKSTQNTGIKLLMGLQWCTNI